MKNYHLGWRAICICTFLAKWFLNIFPNFGFFVFSKPYLMLPKERNLLNNHCWVKASRNVYFLFYVKLMTVTRYTGSENSTLQHIPRRNSRNVILNSSPNLLRITKIIQNECLKVDKFVYAICIQFISPHFKFSQLFYQKFWK